MHNHHVSKLWRIGESSPKRRVVKQRRGTWTDYGDYSGEEKRRERRGKSVVIRLSVAIQAGSRLVSEIWNDSGSFMIHERIPSSCRKGSSQEQATLSRFITPVHLKSNQLKTSWYRELYARFHTISNWVNMQVHIALHIEQITFPFAKIC